MGSDIRYSLIGNRFGTNPVVSNPLPCPGFAMGNARKPKIVGDFLP
jgi:hypothetical protein